MQNKSTSETDDSNQWAVKHRPTSLDTYECSDYVREQVAAFVQSPPNAILIAGGFGNGKTTLARFIAAQLTSEPSDISEIDAVNEGGVDEVRGVVRTSSFRPKGNRRIFIIDEAHALSQQARRAVLVPMEKAKTNVTWIICSNEPHKLDAVMMSRCRKLFLDTPSVEQISKALQRIAKLEKVNKYPVFKAGVNPAVINAMIKEAAKRAGGSIRVGVDNFQTLCDVARNAPKKLTPEQLAKRMRKAYRNMGALPESEAKDIIDLVRKDVPAAIAAVLRSKDQSAFRQIFYATRDYLSDGKVSMDVAQLFQFCVEALRFQQQSGQDPSLYLAACMAKAHAVGSRSRKE